MKHSNGHLKCVPSSLDTIFSVGSSCLVWGPQLFHPRLSERQRCQFVLINLPLGSSLVSNVEVAAAGGGGGRTGTSLLQKGNNALCLYHNKLRYTDIHLKLIITHFMSIFLSKSWLQMFFFVDQSDSVSRCPHWFSAGDGTPREILISWVLEHMWVCYDMFDLLRACKQNVDLKSLHPTKATVRPVCLPDRRSNKPPKSFPSGRWIWIVRWVVYKFIAPLRHGVLITVGFIYLLKEITLCHSDIQTLSEIKVHFSFLRCIISQMYLQRWNHVPSKKGTHELCIAERYKLLLIIIINSYLVFLCLK